MATGWPASLTGIHKRLLIDYTVLELVAHATAWTDTEEGGVYDEGVALERVARCARAYAAANLATMVSNAPRKASAFVNKNYEELSGRSVEHMVGGCGAEQLRVAFANDFQAAYGKPVTWVAVDPAPLKSVAKERTRTLSTQDRAQAIIARLCELPLPSSALQPLLSLLEFDCLRQCLPQLPPAAGNLAPQAWLDTLEDQGPLWEGMWLIHRLREAAGLGNDSAACENLAVALAQELRDAFSQASFSAADGRHMLGKLLVIISMCSNEPRVRSAWASFIANITEGAVRSGTVTNECAAAGTMAVQLHMVLNKLTQTWGLLMIGQWPRERFLGVTCSLAELDLDLSSGAPQPLQEAMEGLEHEVGPQPISAAGEVVGASAALVSRDAEQAPASTIWQPVPVAVVNMAGAALGRLSRLLGGSERRREHTIRENTLFDMDTEEAVDESEGSAGEEL